MSLELLLAWWNLVFVVPFLLALMYLAVYTLSGLTFGDSDFEAAGDLHVDLDADVDADADLHAEADLDADADTDAHIESELHGDGEIGEHDAPIYLAALSWLGLGRVPLSILLMVFFITWGVIGFVVNAIVAPMLPRDWMACLASLPAAVLGSAYLTRGVVRTVGRWMPTTETYVRRTDQLVGTSGEALYPIDQAFGLANVRDRHGDLFQVPCRVYADRPSLAKGDKVLLVDYNAEHKFFYVTAYDVHL